MAGLRFNVEPRDAPAWAAARRLGLTEAVFREALPGLIARGFPPADATTGQFDLDAIDAWRRGRHAHLFSDPTMAKPASAAKARLEARRG